MEERQFSFDGIDITYTVEPGGTHAVARYVDPTTGAKRETLLDASQGGGAYVSGVPDRALAAIRALSFHIWPRPQMPAPRVISNKPRGW